LYQHSSKSRAVRAWWKFERVYKEITCKCGWMSFVVFYTKSQQDSFLSTEEYLLARNLLGVRIKGRGFGQTIDLHVTDTAINTRYHVTNPVQVIVRFVQTKLVESFGNCGSYQWSTNMPPTCNEKNCEREYGNSRSDDE